MGCYKSAARAADAGLMLTEAIEARWVMTRRDALQSSLAHPACGGLTSVRAGRTVRTRRAAMWARS
jgi:hypothetical protein